MLHPIRVYDPQFLHEITLRINGGDHLLDMNCRTLHKLVQGVLAKYANKYCIKVIAFHFLSNHYHGLFKIPSSAMFVRFLTAFHSAMALIINKCRNKPGRVWGENRWYPVTQDATTVAQRIRYIMGQAVAAKLVDHPIQFPGPSSTEWMLDGVPVLGVVVDATAKYRDSQLKDGAKEDDAYVKTVEVPMVPPPCWEGLGDVRLRELYRGLADDGARVTLAELRLLATDPNQSASSQLDEPSAEREEPDRHPADTQQHSGQHRGPRPCQAPEFTAQDYLSDLEKRWLGAKLCILNRVDAQGRPESPGPVKPKNRGARRKKPIYILCADPLYREQYGNQYLDLVDVYRAAKSVWRQSVQNTPNGLFAGGFQLPPHTLVGTMPLVD